jgi:hypothetical protein
MTWAVRVLVPALLLTFNVQAQNPGPSPTGSNQQLLKSEELDALVAPIALYPDALLAQVLMASTYPLEVVQAERFATEHKSLAGDRLKTEAEKQGWDDSVKSLVATPSVLAMMNTKIDWTQKLGDAVLAQQPDVMDAVQRLRTKAYANNKLQSTSEQKVTVSQENNRQVIAIEPTSSGTIYVPYYDPAVVYGEWPYPDYPPYYWYPEPGYIASGIIATGIAFGAGYALWRWTSGGRFWGGRINWGGRQININRGAHVTHWQHNPQHRRGVAYNNASVRQRFAGNTNRAGKRQLDFRGRGGQQVLKPGGDRTKLGEHRPGNRPNAGDRGRGQQRQANRPSTRPSQPSQRRATAHAPSQRRATAHAQPRRATPRAQPRTVAQRPSPRASIGGGGRGRSFGFAAARGGRGGGRGFGGGRGRRSDIRLKHDVFLLGRLDNGLGFYRFAYNGSDHLYVGVMAQEVQTVAPEAVTRDRDGYWRVLYDKLGLKFQTYDQWIASGAQVPRPRRVTSTSHPTTDHPKQ